MLNPGRARVQGSLFSFQKRQVANAVEWIRTNSKNKPLIFVATTSHKWGNTIFTPRISAFVHNLKNGYGVRNFVWVREYNGHGAPHYHFVCDAPFLNAKKLSWYWSKSFGFPNFNSVRLGSKPDKNGRRKYHVESKRMAFYLSKYLGKSMPAKSKMKGRKFQISQEAGAKSKPIKYEVHYHFTDNGGKTVFAQGKMVPAPVYAIGRTYESETGKIFLKENYQWKKAKDHNVWFGREKTAW